uniref:Chaplin domain-containing protein n=1 Tax=Streptomyces sp. NBC_00049 TaxID=2903617 RepID=A0AAU2JJH5_9ACTN
MELHEGDADNPLLDSASDPTTVTGGTCDDHGDDGEGGSILPISLSGIIPMFNNIAINNIKSPNAGNHSRQDFALNNP